MAATATMPSDYALTGQFTPDTSVPIDNAFFKAVFDDRLDPNKVFRKAYYEQVIGTSNMLTWLQQYGGVDYTCNVNNSILEYRGYRNQIKVNADATIAAGPTSPSTFVIAASDHFGGGDYVLPRKGNTLVAPPNGALMDITDVVFTNGDTFTVTVVPRGTTQIELKEGDQLLVLSGSKLEDCACPEGQFALPELPIESDYSMIAFGDKGSLCGDALLACHQIIIPFLDENHKVIPNSSPWYVAEQKKMLQRMETRKLYETLLNEKFGIITKMRTQSIKFTPAITSEITVADVRAWKKDLDQAGVINRDFAVFAGREIFSQFQVLFLEAGVTKLDYSVRPNGQCPWIDMDYCGATVEGLRLHVYEEKSFSNGLQLGSQNMVFPTSAIFIPLDSRPIDSMLAVPDVNRNGTSTDKMFTTVYFQDINGGRYDMRVDANGLLGPRNTFAAGCEEQEWTAKTRFYVETYGLAGWGYIGLGT